MNLKALLTLQADYSRLPKGDQTFAKSLLAQHDKKNSLSPKQWEWVEKLAEECETVGVPDFTKEKVHVGEFGGVLALFEKATQYLKHPAIALMTPSQQKVVLKLAGNNSKAPGTISITNGGPFGNSVWYGRVTKEGVWEPNNQKLTIDLKLDLQHILTQLAVSPAETAAAYGKMTGHCCFCSAKLTDKRSVAVGYGKICSARWGLPWGSATEKECA
jgi:hypothetical protein